jgi:hypothetical protein
LFDFVLLVLQTNYEVKSGLHAPLADFYRGQLQLHFMSMEPIGAV